MSSSDAFWLNFWGIIAAIGFIIVIIGVIIEGVEHFKKFPKKDHARKLHIEKIGWFLVVGGLAMEFLGDHAAKRISDREDARVKREAGDAMIGAANSESNSVQVLAQVAELNKEAGDARKDAGEAMKSASKLDAARADAEKETALIRSNNLELQLQLQPRRITLTQVTNFIFLTQKITKEIPIKVCMGEDEGDTGNYAYQIRNLLTSAGFKTDSAAGVWGITRDPTAIVTVPIGMNGKSPFVLLCVYSTNEDWILPTIDSEITNGFIRPIVTGNDTNKVYSGIYFIFNKIGITTEGMGSQKWVKYGDCEFFIPPKSF